MEEKELQNTESEPTETESTETESTEAEQPSVWSPLQKILFRFAAIYLIWYSLPFFLYPIPGASSISGPVGESWGNFVRYVGNNLLGIEEEVRLGMTGSGDMTQDYLHLLLMIVFSALGCILWSILDRKRPNYEVASRRLLVVCRYYLMIVMLVYGFGKVFPGQFGAPSLRRLMQPYGDSSPMGLLWTFMGFSRPYTIFAGLGEVVGGALMAFRRTTTLGALVICGVMSNVVMMNFAYDVPVKLFSSHLLLMAMILVALDGKRVLNLFLLNRATEPVEYPPYTEDPRKQKILTAVKTLFIVLLLGANIYGGVQMNRQYGPDVPKPELYGIHDVEIFRLDGEELPPLLTDPTRWQTLIVDRYPGSVAVRKMDGKLERMRWSVDSEKGVVVFTKYGETESEHEFTFERPEPDRLVIAGDLGDGPIEVEMKERDLDEFLLTSRGFNWINEVPFNR